MSRRMRITLFTTLLALVAAPAAAQSDAYRYAVSYVQGGDTTAAEAVQGLEYTMLAAPGDGATPDNAWYYMGPALDHQVREAEPDAVGLVHFPWPHTRSQSGDTLVTDQGDTLVYQRFDVRLEPGDEERPVAGRTARRYDLHASIVKTLVGASRTDSLSVEGTYWVLEDVPFTWAPFAIYGTTALPAMDPRLRDVLREKLDGAGLPGRMKTRIVYEVRRPSGPGGSTQERETWIGELTPATPPPAPSGLVVSQDFLDELDTRMKEGPGPFCASMQKGTPDFVARELEPAAADSFMARLKELCARAGGS